MTQIHHISSYFGSVQCATSRNVQLCCHGLQLYDFYIKYDCCIFNPLQNIPTLFRWHLWSALSLQGMEMTSSVWPSVSTLSNMLWTHCAPKMKYMCQDTARLSYTLGNQSVSLCLLVSYRFWILIQLSDAPSSSLTHWKKRHFYSIQFSSVHFN